MISSLLSRWADRIVARHNTRIKNTGTLSDDGAGSGGEPKVVVVTGMTDLASEGGGDYDFMPDHRVGDGDVVTGNGWSVEALHTPGHCSNHLCFALREEDTLLCGDHVMGWSTSIVSPPDGDMADYMASLQKVNYGCQGYAGAFCLSIMDRDWQEGLTEDEAIAIVEKCVAELATRFLVAQPNFIIKVIDEGGLRTVKFGEDPADT